MSSLPAQTDKLAPVSNAEAVDVDEVFVRARRAQQAFAATAGQATLDRAALAAAWALMEPSRNCELATLAVETTGLGRVEDNSGITEEELMALCAKRLGKFKTPGRIHFVTEMPTGP